MDSFNLLELLKKKPISNPNLNFGIKLKDTGAMGTSVTGTSVTGSSATSTSVTGSSVTGASSVTGTTIAIKDKTDKNNIKRQMAFKERINQMKINNLLSVKKKPKTVESVLLTKPITQFTKQTSQDVEISIEPQIKQTTKQTTQTLQTTQQRMAKIVEKRIKKKKEREDRKIQKLLSMSKIRDERQLKIDKKLLLKRKSDIQFKVDPYFLNNRETFVNFINQKLYDTKKKRGEDSEVKTCDELNASKHTGNFSLLLHQEIVKEYLNIYSPYRGLFLYFGLGAGKTCASIAIAEGLKDYNKVVVMTPASLEKNYMTELKFCGDDIFRKNHYWEFVKNSSTNSIQIEELVKVLNIPNDILRKNDGIWAINTSPPKGASGNYNELSPLQQQSLNKQIDAMIANKYTFIHYNGLRNIDKYEAEGIKNGGNYFNNKVVIIDEVHNFVGTISNQLGEKKSFNYKLYNYLMDAENCKIVFLTGTPIINYPNEIGIFFNMLRGRIKTYEFTLKTTSNSKIKTLNLKYLKKILYDTNNQIDHIEYNNTNKKLIITRNPFQFITRYKKVNDKRGKPMLISHVVKRKANSEFEIFRNDGSYESVFISKIIETLENKGIQLSTSHSSDCEKMIKEDELDEDKLGDEDELGEFALDIKDSKSSKGNKSKSNESNSNESNEMDEATKDIYRKVCIKKYKCLPDDYDSFVAKFIDPNTQELINKNIFKKRIMGLTSYFKAAVEALLPTFNEHTDITNIQIPMSDYQLSVYNPLRDNEIGNETDAGIQMATTDGIYSSSASYKIYSRECCNIAFPEDIERPRPVTKKKKHDTETKEGKETKETKLVNLLDAENADSDEVVLNGDEPVIEDKTYDIRVKEALIALENNKHDLFVGENLKKYSPKFDKILENLTNQVINNDDSTSEGTHLVYSFYSNVEGLGIFKMVMEANGYARFKIAQNKGSWEIDMTLTDLQKPCYILYSGNEKTEEKEYLRLIFNSEWDKLPDRLRKQLLSIKNRTLPPEDDTTLLNNFHGEVIKVFMITAAGAEGITLKNVRAVHLMEPYWHPVRFEQVIGRAVRICSHENLPEHEQKVKVYIYLMTFSQEQIKGNPEAKNEGMKKPIVSTLILLKDKSKDLTTVLTSDQKLFEISSIKKKINASILKAIKESSIDCKIHKKDGDNLQCFTINYPNVEEYFYNPDFAADAPSQEEQIEWKPHVVTIKGKKYILKKYDENSDNMNGVLYNYKAYNKDKSLIYFNETAR